MPYDVISFVSLEPFQPVTESQTRGEGSGLPPLALSEALGTLWPKLCIFKRLFRCSSTNVHTDLASDIECIPENSKKSTVSVNLFICKGQNCYSLSCVYFSLSSKSKPLRSAKCTAVHSRREEYSLAKPVCAGFKAEPQSVHGDVHVE